MKKKKTYYLRTAPPKCDFYVRPYSVFRRAPRSVCCARISNVRTVVLDQRFPIFRSEEKRILQWTTSKTVRFVVRILCVFEVNYYYENKKKSMRFLCFHFYQ